MERSGAIPQVGVAAPDLVETLAAPGPFATVVLTTEADVENAAQRSELHWKSLRAELTDAGAPESALEAIDALVPEAHTHGQAMLAIANAVSLLHVEHFPQLPKRDVARWSALPLTLPIIEWRQESPAYVVVLADRLGADVHGFRREGSDLHLEAGGDDDPIRKVQPGGWSQRRYQQRAENTWEKNADDVAKEVVRLAEHIDARLVIAAGDVRALQLLQESLPPEILECFDIVEGDRNEWSLDSIADDVVRLVSTAVAADTVSLLEKFKEERGQGDQAVEGVGATLAALTAGQVDTLLIGNDPDDERTAYFGLEGIPVGTSASALTDLGVERPTEGPLLDVAVRAALGTSARVRLVPSAGAAGPREGIGALLRWA